MLKANDIIQICGIPYTIKRIYKTDNPELTHKIRFTAYSYTNNNRIDAAITGHLLDRFEEGLKC